MKIAVISFHTCPLSRLGVMDAGGMNVYILSLYKELAKLGWQIDVYTRFRGYEKEQVVYAASGFRIIHIPLSKVDLTKQYLRGFVDEFVTGIVNFAAQKEISYDVMHAHYFLSGLAALKLKERWSIPLVSTFHTLGVMKRLYGGRQDTQRIEDEKQIVNNSDRLVVSTPLEGDELVSYYQADRNHVEVVTPGVDHTIFKPRDKHEVRKQLGIPLDRKVIVFAGRIDPIKGITVLIEALGNLRATHAEFHECVCTYLIGGDIEKDEFWELPEVVKIQSLIKKHNIDCCVEFIGAKPHDELALYYTAADVVVAPSLYESFGLSTLEAMAAGSTVVASKVGGLSFLIQDTVTGRLFTNKSSIDLARVLEDVVHDTAARTILGRNAFEFAKQFSWSKQAQKIANIYQQFLNPKSEYRNPK